ncbi:hypothetical protein BH11ARM2_BH11ARM2_07570 [soil metagenome]
MSIDPALHERLLHRLKARDRFESELRREFGEEPGFEPSLERLKAQGFVDDRRVAQALIHAKSPTSKALLQALLTEKSVNPDDFLADHDDLAAARQIAAKRRGEPHARVARYLASKGFEPETIESALEEG